MSDVFTKAKRSEVMSRIRGRGNKETEIALMKIFRAHGITGWRRQHSLRFTVHGSRFRVRPDFIFCKQHVAVFVDGCFWHGCPKHSPPAKWLKKSSMPAGGNSRKPPLKGGRAASGGKAQRTGILFWRRKLAANKARDRFVNRTLQRQGWIVLRIWEHELTRNPARCLARIQRMLQTHS